MDPKNQFQALQRRRGQGIDLTIIIGKPEDAEDAEDENEMDPSLMDEDDADMQDNEENDETMNKGLAPDILDANSPDSTKLTAPRSTQDGDMHAIDEELGDTDNAADDENPMNMMDVLGKGRPNGLRARAAQAYTKRFPKK